MCYTCSIYIYIFMILYYIEAILSYMLIYFFYFYIKQKHSKYGNNFNIEELTYFVIYYKLQILYLTFII